MPRRSRAKRCSSPARSISTRTTRSLSRSSERGVFVMRCLTVPLALAAFAAAALLSRGAARAVELTIVPVQTALAHHAVTTKNPAAQQAFDEGLTLIYAFNLSLIHISEPTRQAEISYAVFCLQKTKRRPP